jgi:Terminase large subunit, T4likevirus-type, N-terminal
VAETAPELLARLFPPLARYWPNLNSVSVPQTSFLLLDQLEAFYGGAAGGGKSDALLAAALQYVDVPGYAALILRKTFRQLDQPDAIMTRSKEWLTPHKPNGVKWNDDAKRWTFPSGATLTFGYLEHHDDVYNYQGAAYQFVGWDELTQFDSKPYEYLFSRTRRNKKLLELGIPIRHRSASNPGGIGHTWVRKRFIEKKTRQKGAVFIPAKVDDNPGLDVDEYKSTMGIGLDETLLQQLLDGNWGVFELAAFHVTDDHLVDEFELDDAMARFEALDYGLNGAPWGLWATDYEGNVVAVDMEYWRNELPSDIAPEIVELRKHGWGLKNVCYADPSLWHRTGGKKWGRPQMLNDEFSDNGVPLVQANNDPRAGFTRLRELLKLDTGDTEKGRPPHRYPSWHPRAGEPGAPRLFLVRDACEELIEELQAAVLQPLDKKDGGEKIDPDWESRSGHAVAMARYAVMSKPDASTEPPPEEEEPRVRFVRQLRERADQEIEELRRRPRGRSYIT